MFREVTEDSFFPRRKVWKSGYISHDNSNEINTLKCPIQTQCG